MQKNRKDYCFSNRRIVLLKALKGREKGMVFCRRYRVFSILEDNGISLFVQFPFHRQDDPSLFQEREAQDEKVPEIGEGP